MDGYRWVFVSDFFDIKVCDSDGAHRRKIEIGGGPFGPAFDGQNNLYTSTTKKPCQVYAPETRGGGMRIRELYAHLHES